MQSNYVILILTSICILVGCNQKKDEIISGEMVIRSHENDGSTYLAISKVEDNNDSGSIILSFDDKGKFIELVTIVGGPNRKVYIDLNSQIEPVSISVEQTDNNSEKFIHDIGKLGSYDMIIDSSTGKIEAVSLENNWIPSRITDDGVEIKKEGRWLKLDKNDDGFEIKSHSEK